MRITLQGQVPAKKNSRAGVVRGNRIMNFPSQTHRRWEEDVLKQLMEYRGQADKRVCITYFFYVKDERKRDIDNMICSVNDVLVKSGLLKDDSWKWLSIGAADAALDRQNPRALLLVEEI